MVGALNSNAQIKDNHVPSISDLLSGTMDLNALFDQLKSELDNSRGDWEQFFNPNVIDSVMNSMDGVDLNKELKALNFDLNGILKSDMFQNFMQDSVFQKNIFDQLLNNDFLEKLMAPMSPQEGGSDEEKSKGTSYKI